MLGKKYELDIYLDNIKIAVLTLTEDQLYWHYNPSWQNSGFAISPHLPLQGKIPTLNVQIFLRNLLPEGDKLEELVKNLHLRQSNTFGLVQALGLDIPGGLIILAKEQSLPQNASFRIITNNEVEERLNKRDHQSLIIWDGKPRLSVAGVQDKINVVVNEQGQLGFGEGNLCSTHILKFEKQTLSHLVLNEFITMQLAKQCGLNVANTQMLRFGKHTALLVERFDRKFFSMSEVKRRHMIDGCQALNLSPDYKYERHFGNHPDVAHIRDGASLIKLFDFANQCMSPASIKQQILDWVLFNVLIFNFDAHGKNISFFVGPDGMRLTPFYDLINIKLYPDFEHDFAMGIGDTFDSSVINAYQLADFAESCQLPRAFVAHQLQNIIKKLKLGLNNIMLSATNNDEQHFLKEYQSIVNKRCEHLLSQIGIIKSIEL